MTTQKTVQTPAGTPLPAVFSCSPRPGGNSEYAAQMFCQGLTEGLSAASPGTVPDIVDSAAILHLRKHTIRPCIGCHACEKHPQHLCFQHEQDDVSMLYEYLLTAPSVFFSAPTYFYFLPAQFKAWIDRAQSLWFHREDANWLPNTLPPRKAYICLIAARKKGKKLFAGSLQTLEYLLNMFNFVLHEPACILGVDDKGEFAQNAPACETLTNLGRDAAQDYITWTKRS